MADLFGGAAPCYAKYRSRPREPVIAHLAAAFGADSTVLYLGYGPGTPAIPLAGRVREVLAVDPGLGMLTEAGAWRGARRTCTGSRATRHGRWALTTVTEVVTARRPPRLP
ncbi:hypothetical protein AB0K18_25310 [Nonomuraea sp. NPDC049421]|uniref:hypothetical protein n=1 Tax=Nonomuraea sp. NPDC049421 TaxID=3155275 RepID=UPI003426315E